WLFSKEFENSSPKGIGLSQWRFNIGAGSAQQGDYSGIKDEWRRSESMIEPDGVWNWDTQLGQRWFLKAAQSRGVENFIGFVNSPPVALTKNAKAYSSGDKYFNLSEFTYNDYAKFLASVIYNIQDKDSVFLNSISPFNEPQWDWADGSQEGSPIQNYEIKDIAKVIDQLFKQRNIQTKIEITEAGKLNYLFEKADKPGRGEQIKTFFDPVSKYYSGNISRISKTISAHSYFTTWPLDTLVAVRELVKKEIEKLAFPVEFIMSEYCILDDNKEIKGNKRDLGINTALYVARIIFADLSIANASSWSWWLAISPYNFKDGLIYIDKNTQNGKFYDSKTLWALGNYSRFIRPGMQRYELIRNDNLSKAESLENLMASSYLSEDKKFITSVFVNYSENEKEINFDLSNLPLENDLNIYITDKERNLKFSGKLSKTDNLIIPPKSILTLSNMD
ncbi:MAG: hypothetical protein RIR51_1587, partial [Bacteroidota bacterium]